MQNQENLSPAEKALESALGQLKPAAGRMNRDELMFNAGRASSGRKGSWQMLSGVLTVLLLSSVLIRPDANRSQQLASAPDHGAFEVAQTLERPARVESGGSLEYVTLRQNVIERGLDALPVRRAVGGVPSKSRKQLLESMLSS